MVTLKCIVDDNGVPTDDLDPTVIKELESVKCHVTKVSEARTNDAVLKFIDDGIKRANKQAPSKAQNVQKFIVLPTDFSIAGDELGPTLKLKRRVVLEKYGQEIEDMYA